MITRIAPRILTDALTALIDLIDQAAPATSDSRRDGLDDAIVRGYSLLWCGVELERDAQLYTFQIDGQQHTVNGSCSCGQRCAARAAKKLLELVELQTPRPPRHSGYPCIHCGATLQAAQTPGGERAYECPACQWTVSTLMIGETMLANGRCAHCGRRLESTDDGPLDMILHACPEPLCTGYRDYR